jgi:glucosyl-3-phosphoglycerate synthase
LTTGTIELVKGTFKRPLRVGDRCVPDEGGRVTELMARPLLNLHDPQLAGFSQPIAGEFAARRDLLESIAFPVGYGVEIAVLMDALKLRGLSALAECDLGTRQNRHQSVRDLGEMAYAVLAAVENRLECARRVTDGGLLQPWQNDAIASIEIHERPALRTIPTNLAQLTSFPTAHRGDRERICG